MHSLLPPDVEVVSLGAGPEVQFLRSLGQLPRGTRVAICCLDNDRATRVRTMVSNIGVQHLDMMAIGVDEEDKLKRALGEVDVVYVSSAAYPEARRIVRNPGRLRTYRFDLDRAGVEMLKARLAELRKRTGAGGSARAPATGLSSGSARRWDCCWCGWAPGSPGGPRARVRLCTVLRGHRYRLIVGAACARAAPRRTRGRSATADVPIWQAAHASGPGGSG